MKGDVKSKLIPQAEERIEDVRWIPKQSMSEPLKNTYPSISEIIEYVSKII